MITDEQLVAMTQQYDQGRDGNYVAHDGYALINAQVKAGRPWAKCPNCGQPYPLDRPGANESICSPECYDAYVKYVTEEARIW